MPEFTPTEKRILNVLADGKPHEVEELRACLDDELAGETALMFHIFRIRKKLKPYGQYIRSLLAHDELPACYVHITRDSAAYIPASFLTKRISNGS